MFTVEGKLNSLKTINKLKKKVFMNKFYEKLKKVNVLNKKKFI